MAAKSDSGICCLCESTYTGKGIFRHLATCLPKHIENPHAYPDEKPRTLFHIRVQGLDRPQYWLHIVLDAESKLEDLDDFLRNIWLECCGHLSAFYHGHQRFDMDQQLNHVLRPGMEILYRYDFGKATELKLRGISVYDAAANGWKPVHLLARNRAPEIPCSVCGNAPAVKVCTACVSQGNGWLCESCAKKHPCGEEIILPVLNSPRTGVCGYDGKLIG